MSKPLTVVALIKKLQELPQDRVILMQDDAHPKDWSVCYGAREANMLTDDKGKRCVLLLSHSGAEPTR